jgi:hypothetical protein
MCEDCRREARAAYRGNPETMGRVPPWEEGCGMEYCESCGQKFTPRYDDQRRCDECDEEELADEDERGGGR